MKIKRYSIDLSTQMAACDANYIRILKLLPRLSKDSVREVAIPGAGPVERIVFLIEVTESFKYTSTVRISQCLPDSGNAWFQPPEMLIRMYHDANTAEVISYQNHKFFKAVYPVPNRHMYHVNEKEQLNLFLTEWLNLCLDKGISNDEVEYLDCAAT